MSAPRPPFSPDERRRVAQMLSRHGEFFSALPAATLEELISTSAHRRFDAGEVLMRQGAPGDHAVLVLSGAVSVAVEGPFGKATVGRLDAGELVGELAVFAPIARSATVRAIEDTDTLVLSRDSIRAAAEAHPKILSSVVAGLGARIARMNDALATLTGATRALSKGRFQPEMLDTLNRQADEFSQFAKVFREMAAEIAEKETLRREMDTAAAIQRAFLPAASPEGSQPGLFEVDARMVPARDVGGDFYDFFMIDAQTVGFAVADVSGKGTPAAMFMGVARTVLKTLARDAGGAADAGAVLTRVNAALAEDNAASMFVTLAFGCLDLASGTLDFASAGHEEAVILRAGGGAPEVLPVTGPALGLFEGASIGRQVYRLAPGDRVLLATDGVTEAFNAAREPLGWDRFLAAIPEEGSAPDTVAAIFDAVAGFVGDAPPSDDVTALALQLHRLADA